MYQHEKRFKQPGLVEEPCKVGYDETQTLNLHCDETTSSILSVSRSNHKPVICQILQSTKHSEYVSCKVNCVHINYHKTMRKL